MKEQKKAEKYAFISYMRKDALIAKVLSYRLVLYHLPKNMKNEFNRSKRLTPIFRDREVLTAGELTDTILNALDASKFLIVVCTKNSTESDWVNKEVKHFLSNHDIDHLIAFVPPSHDKNDNNIYFVSALQDVINELKAEKEDFDILAVVQEKEELEPGLLSRMFPNWFRYEKSYIRIIAKILGKDFNQLWDEQKKFIRRVIRYTLCVLFFILFWALYFGVPISVPISIHDAVPNENLPKGRNIELTIGDAKYPLSSLDTTIVIKDIPGKYRFRSIPLKINATYYKTIEQQLEIGSGLFRHYDVPAERDSTFAIFYGTVIDENGNVVEGADVRIEDKQTKTNKRGCFRIVFNVEEQSETKPIIITKAGVGVNKNPFETPDSSMFILKNRQ